MYESHYGLDAKPFQLTPDPKFFFASKWHKRALSYLQYGLSQGEGFIVITGDIGTGKTTLANSLLANIETDIVAAQIVTPKLSPDEIINVGGLKVYPAEIESILLEIDNVEDVVVFQEPHPITGSIVCAKFKLVEEESKRDFKAKTFTFCKDKLASYKIPTKIEITLDNTYNERFKRMRR